MVPLKNPTMTNITGYLFNQNLNHDFYFFSFENMVNKYNLEIGKVKMWASYN
jgi:hypothetical protein